MKSKTLILPVLATGTLWFAGTLLAQNQSVSVPQHTPPTKVTNTLDGSQFTSPQGVPVTINSSMPPVPTLDSAPSFEQLSGGGKSISEDQAKAYPPLANDFIYADKNRDGHISKSEYELWLKQK
ncbi:hypothetical protein [Dyella tabacisoli]|uniref:EF-hand domain-containing protein n=1 Tax=Dyella tabacisoli TaxID=2282381 RepID=A0A369UM48_9GAMM|nr:hypothetical protein [Dyella tabacisoli]RDD81822.1 hypothetical protein DVJ77_11785 [Dyella tabacisoli]